MKALKITLKTLITFLTTIWGIFFGIIAPLIYMSGELEIASHYVFKLWVAMSIIGFFAPCFLVMLNYTKIAAASSGLGTILTLIIHTALTALQKENPAINNVSFMYLPQIFMTIFIIIYIFITNHQYIEGKNKHDLPAPSILSDRKEPK